MYLSRFGTKIGGKTGIVDLMDDMGRALAGSEKKYMLGGGNPAQIPAIESVWKRRIAELSETERGIEGMLGNYDTPQGQPAFADAVSGLLREEFGWDIGPEHVAVTNGSQTAFFLLLNMLTGPGRVLFPLLPEYIGYADQAITDGAFVACKPRVGRVDDHTHKYHIDFEAVEDALRTAGDKGDDPITAICVSRPTNPSGNVLTDDEIHRLDAIARARGIPLIIDNAYGLPFPHIVFDEAVEGSAQPIWNENIILGMSLSKIGLPGARTGIIVASPEVVETLSRANAVVSLANTMVGQVLVEPIIRDRSILQLSRDTVMPFYRQRSHHARTVFEREIDPGIPYSFHRIEGSIFMWLWLPDLPIPTIELYQRLKKRDLLVVPGNTSFSGRIQPVGAIPKSVCG
jgi:valine--pyruvate aminotransferase